MGFGWVDDTPSDAASDMLAANTMTAGLTSTSIVLFQSFRHRFMHLTEGVNGHSKVTNLVHDRGHRSCDFCKLLRAIRHNCGRGDVPKVELKNRSLSFTNPNALNNQKIVCRSGNRSRVQVPLHIELNLNGLVSIHIAIVTLKLPQVNSGPDVSRASPQEKAPCGIPKDTTGGEELRHS